MIIERLFHNIQCDHCGALIDDETWWDDKEALVTAILPECGWIECEGRHYCDMVVKKDCDKEYTEAMNQVLSVVGKKLNVEETTD